METNKMYIILAVLSTFCIVNGKWIVRWLLMGVAIKRLVWFSRILHWTCLNSRKQLKILIFFAYFQCCRLDASSVQRKQTQKVWIAVEHTKGSIHLNISPLNVIAMNRICPVHSAWKSFNKDQEDLFVSFRRNSIFNLNIDKMGIDQINNREAVNCFKPVLKL